VERIGSTLFVHGGISPIAAREGLPALNAAVERDLRLYHTLRGELVRRGAFDGLAPFVEVFERTRRWLDDHGERSADPAEPAALLTARRFLGLTESPLFRQDGPLWDRQLARGDERTLSPFVDEVLRETGTSRIVVGHTTRDDGRIGMRFDRRVFVIDTGAGPSYGGRASALEIRPDGTVRAIYADRTDVLVAPRMADADVESFLREGRVVESKEIGSGVTRPKKLLLERDGATLSAAFKTVDVQETKVTRFSDSVEMNFSDRYVYERAAYLLDRQLGLGMVPVSVLRTIDGTPGVLVAWVPDAIDEGQRSAGGLLPADLRRLTRQRSVMRVFDALIYNTDRNQGNQLYTPDWKLHLIDHSRSFRLRRRPPDGFFAERVSLPRSLADGLRGLDAETLGQAMHGILSKLQVKAVLARRDAILEKIEQDRARFGDALVFQE
jgi:hypothetical protein